MNKWILTLLLMGPLPAFAGEGWFNENEVRIHTMPDGDYTPIGLALNTYYDFGELRGKVWGFKLGMGFDSGSESFVFRDIGIDTTVTVDTSRGYFDLAAYWNLLEGQRTAYRVTGGLKLARYSNSVTAENAFAIAEVTDDQTQADLYFEGTMSYQTGDTSWFTGSLAYNLGDTAQATGFLDADYGSVEVSIGWKFN